MDQSKERIDAIPGEVLSDEVIPAGEPWGKVVKRGDILRIVDLGGEQAVDFLCYNAQRPEERYNAPNTLKASRTLRLTRGHVLYSDRARPIFTIVEDTCGIHDTIGGCCSEPSNEMLYGVKGVPGCRENFLRVLGSFGLGGKDIVPNVNFFCNVPVAEGGKLADALFTDAPSRTGDLVDLRAEMDALAIISNCPQVNNPCTGLKPTPIRVIVWHPKHSENR
jgi:urea carboxylase-associated protein 1